MTHIFNFFARIKKIDGCVSCELFRPTFASLPMLLLIGDYHHFDTKCQDQTDCHSLYASQLFKKIDNELQMGDLLLEMPRSLPDIYPLPKEHESALDSFVSNPQTFNHLKIHWGDLRILVGNEHLQDVIKAEMKYTGDAIVDFLRGLLDRSSSLTIAVRTNWIKRMTTLFAPTTYPQLKQVFHLCISQFLTYDAYMAHDFFQKFGRMSRELAQVPQPFRSFIHDRARQEYSTKKLFYFKELTEFVERIDDWSIEVLDVDRIKVKGQLANVCSYQRTAMDVYSISRFVKSRSPFFMLYFGQGHIESMKNLVQDFYQSILKFYQFDFQCVVPNAQYKSTDLIINMLAGLVVLDDHSLFSLLNSPHNIETYFKFNIFDRVLGVDPMQQEQRKRMLHLIHF